MKRKRRLAVLSGGVAAVLAASALMFTTAMPASSSPRQPDIGQTLAKLQAASDKLTKAQKDALVAKYDHTMGSQIERVEGPAKEVADQPTTEQATPTKTSDTQTAQSSSGTAQVQSTSSSCCQLGIDVSGHQGNVNWSYWWNNSRRFAYVKATEGTGYTNPYFASQYNGSYLKGFIRGAYHFALPNKSWGSTQAKYFVAHGGGWSGDGKTLPGVVDLEWNPYGSSCYGMTKSSMHHWIKAFRDQYHSMTGRYPVIYTSTSWWKQCVSTTSSGFQYTMPLWIARYNSYVGTLPAGWSVWSFWQYSDGPPDQNRWNGSLYRLKLFASH